MPRNTSGTYTAPTGNPVVTGTAISSTVHNATVADMAAELTDSLSRSGKGGMLVPLGFSDGIVSAPGITLNSETTSGIYRAGAGDVRFSVLGVDVWSWVKSGATYLVKVLGTALGVDLVQPVTANTTITVKGNRTDVSTGTDVTVNTSAARTDGLLLDVQNNGTTKFAVGWEGNIWENGLEPGTAAVASDVTITNAAFADVTGLTFTVPSTSGTYMVEALVFAVTNDAGSVPVIQWTGPFATSGVKYDFQVADTAGSLGADVAAAWTTSLGATTVASTSCSIKSTLLFTQAGLVGPVQLQAHGSAGGGKTLVVQKGSFMRWRRVV